MTSPVLSPLLLPGPLQKQTSRPSRGRRLLYVLGTVIFAGVALHLLFSSGPSAEAEQPQPWHKDWWAGKDRTTIVYENCHRPSATHSAPSPIRTSELTTWPDGSKPQLSVDEVRAMVAKTKGFYARDYSLGLGWNNVRYIIEASLFHAQLLNRTLILPSFVYARACEYDIHVCAAYAKMVNRGDAVGWNEWRDLPEEQQMGWRIPMELMLDLNHLRKKHSVILISDYLRMHDMPVTREQSNGMWYRDLYHDGPQAPSLHVIPNETYDPQTIVRVDSLRGLSSPPVDAEPNEVALKLQETMKARDKNVLDWNDARVVVRSVMPHVDVDSDTQLQEVIEESGWSVLHTFKGALGMDYLKSVVEPIKQVAPRSSLRGIVEDYDKYDEGVLVLAGETHLNRKPGGVRFTSVQGREDFARLVLQDIQPIPKVKMLAAKVVERMYKKVGGRMYIGGHMRRGDFVRVGWAMEGTLQGHLARIKQRLAKGRAILRDLSDPHTFDIPDTKVDHETLARPFPLDSDPFYLATDERSPEGVKYLKENGAILIDDLLTMEDRRIFGWPLMITDVLALVEQQVLSHTAYFYAHAMSSVAGGVVNLRAANGADPRTTLID